VTPPSMLVDLSYLMALVDPLAPDDFKYTITARELKT